MEEPPKPIQSSQTVTQTVGEIPSQDSTMFGVSIRAWIAMVLVSTVCGSHLSGCAAVLIDAVRTGDWSKVGTYMNIGEPLYSMAVAALGFYFGQKSNKP